MKNNPFIAKSIVKIAFAESPNFYVIYNQAPILPGHSLVIPKKEIISFRDFSDFEIVELTLLSRRAVEVLEKVFGARDFNWTIQDGEAAGQTVPHFHLHLIPRKQGDLNDPGDWYPELIDSYSGKNIDSESRVKFSQVELELIVSQIRDIAVEANLKTSYGQGEINNMLEDMIKL